MEPVGGKRVSRLQNSYKEHGDADDENQGIPFLVNVEKGQQCGKKRNASRRPFRQAVKDTTGILERVLDDLSVWYIRKK
jgi:hypothetical protein